jgi:hypothetical protein
VEDEAVSLGDKGLNRNGSERAVFEAAKARLRSEDPVRNEVGCRWVPME